jgi:hypothetical protein
MEVQFAWVELKHQHYLHLLVLVVL